MASLEARGHDPSESGLVMGDRPCLASNINNTLGEHLRILYIIYIYVFSVKREHGPGVSLLFKYLKSDPHVVTL